jgi:4-hydroxybenzoate polyprenyltransferase
MNTPWIIGGIAFVIFFGVVEAYAFRHADRLNTLSRAIALLGEKWPLSIALVGLLTGVLLAHFYWPWCANPLGAGAG